MHKFSFIWAIISLALADTGKENISKSAITFGVPNAFTKIGNNHYLIVERKFNWFEAAHFCRANNADLANIQSEDELQALYNYLLSKGKHHNWYWLDGNDLGKKGSYYSLTTGLPMIFQKWSKGQPDNAFENEDCVHLWLMGNSFEMNDLNCNRVAFFLCKARNSHQWNINSLAKTQAS